MNKTTGADLFSTRNDLAAETRVAMVELLNQQLANLTDLFAQTKHAHWNVKGPQFWALHKMFDKLAEKVEGHIDSVAERATALGGVARGTVRMAASDTQLDDFPEGTHAGLDVVRVLADRYATAGQAARQAADRAAEYGDADTNDLLIGVSRDLDESLYFLESHLQAE